MLAYELCLAGVGGELSAHPEHLLSALTDEQWAGWCAFSTYYGDPRTRGDVWAGIVAHASAAPHIKKRLGIKDFFPKWGKRLTKRRTPEELAKAARERHEQRVAHEREKAKSTRGK